MGGWTIVRLRRPWWQRWWPVSDTVRAGVEWVRRQHLPSLKSVTVVVDPRALDVSGACTTLGRKRGRRRYSRIHAIIPAQYPRACRHYITYEPIPIATAAEAVVFILGHEAYHIRGRQGEPAAEAQGLAWLDAYRQSAQE